MIVPEGAFGMRNSACGIEHIRHSAFRIPHFAFV